MNIAKNIMITASLVSLLASGGNLVLDVKASSHIQESVNEVGVNYIEEKEEFLFSYDQFLEILNENKRQLVLDEQISSTHVNKDAQFYVDLIIKNSDEYIRNSSEATKESIESPFNNKHFSDKIDLYSIFKECIQELFDKNLCNEADLNRLSKLVVVSPTGPYFNIGAYSTDDNILTLPLSALNEYTIEKFGNGESSNNEDLKKVITKTLKHELNHFAQSNFLTEMMPFSFIVEGSAESILDGHHNDYMTYQEERKGESLISLMVLANGYTEKDYYEAVYSNNLDLLLKLCGATTDEEKYYIYNILCDLDVRIDTGNRTEPYRGTENLKFEYDESIYHLDDYSRKTSVGTNYISNIYGQAISNLIATSDSRTYAENLLIFGIIKERVNKELEANNNMEVNKILLSSVENEYKNHLSDKYDIKLGGILKSEKFNEYTVDNLFGGNINENLQAFLDKYGLVNNVVKPFEKKLVEEINSAQR